MRVSDRYDLHTIVKELEIAFQIDGSDAEERDLDVLIQNIKSRINRQYSIDITEYKVDAVELELCDFRKSVMLFIDNIARIHSNLCGYAMIKRYKAENDISLSSINYLGVVEEDLKTTLIAMQREVYLPRAEESISAIKNKLGTINNCWEKRLFVLAVVAHEIGFDEVMASIAEILLQSMIE